MTMKWFLVMWLITPDGEYTPGYNLVGFEDKLQPAREVCIEKAEHNNAQNKNKFWTCIGHFS